jgi:hypothetical protein
MIVFDTTMALIVGIVIGAAFAPFWMMVWANYILPAGQWAKAKLKAKFGKKD